MNDGNHVYNSISVKELFDATVQQDYWFGKLIAFLDSINRHIISHENTSTLDRIKMIQGFKKMLLQRYLDQFYEYSDYNYDEYSYLNI